MYCVHCGTALPEGAAFCPSCGTAVARRAPAAGGSGEPPAPPSPAPPGGETPAPWGVAPAPAPPAAPWPGAADGAAEPAGDVGMPPGYVGPPTPVLVVRPAAVRYGGFWRRFWGAFLDSIILNVVMLPISFAMGFSWARFPMDEEDITPEWAMSYLGGLMTVILVGTILTWLYAALMQSSSKQGTLGQLALGLKVTDLQGRRISFARATGRYFATLITGLTLTIGYLVMLFTEKRQTLHDLIAGTLVVR